MHDDNGTTITGRGTVRARQADIEQFQERGLMRPWQLVGLTAIIAAIALAVGWHPLYIVTYTLLAALLVSVLWNLVGTQGLTFTRTAVGGRAQVGERIEERLALENHSAFPKLWVQVS